MNRQTILLIDDDRQITGGLATALEADGRTIVVCADIESAEAALASLAITDVVSDVQFSGLFGFEGLHFADRMRSRCPAARLILMTGYWSDALRGAASSYGAQAMLTKPFDISELERALGHAPGDGGPFELIEVPTVDEILAGGRLETAFQPIVTMNSPGGEPFAFEALARIRGGWPLGGVLSLFEYAARRGRAADLNRAAIVSAIQSASALPRRSLLFINVDPPTFNDPNVATEILSTAERSGLSPDRLVLEITERSALTADARCTETFATLRAAGVRVALDDHASAYSHMSTISMTQPSFFKISGAFATGFETDLNKQRVVRNVLALAQEFGCSTVIEGIETEATASAAARLGIELAQGYFYSKPRSASHWSEVAA